VVEHHIDRIGGGASVSSVVWSEPSAKRHRHAGVLSRVLVLRFLCFCSLQRRNASFFFRLFVSPSWLNRGLQLTDSTTAFFLLTSHKTNKMCCVTQINREQEALNYAAFCVALDQELRLMELQEERESASQQLMRPVDKVHSFYSNVMRHVFTMLQRDNAFTDKIWRATTLKTLGCGLIVLYLLVRCESIFVDWLSSKLAQVITKWLHDKTLMLECTISFCPQSVAAHWLVQLTIAFLRFTEAITLNLLTMRSKRLDEIFLWRSFVIAYPWSVFVHTYSPVNRYDVQCCFSLLLVLFAKGFIAFGPAKKEKWFTQA